MEEQASTSLGDAYTQILVNYDDTSISEKESKLRYAFLNSMQKAYKCSDTASLNYYDLEKLFNSLSPEVQKYTELQDIISILGMEESILIQSRWWAVPCRRQAQTAPEMR